MFIDLLKVRAKQIPNFCKPRDVGRNARKNRKIENYSFIQKYFVNSQYERT